MAFKDLQTRIALKYDSYAAWTDDTVANAGANLKLLKGEVGLCEIPGTVSTVVENGKTVNVRTAPTVLFKVGAYKKDAEGNETTELLAFKDLPWVSAKAADVYDWAKKSEAEFKTWLSETAAFATDAEVAALLSPINADIADIKNSLSGATEGGIGKAIDALDARLDVIEGADTVAGSVAKALKDAKAYTDEREVEIKKYADQAETDAVTAAKAYTDEAVKTGNQASADLAEHKQATNPHGITAATVGLDKVENKTVAEIKSEFTGAVSEGDTGFVTGDAVVNFVTDGLDSVLSSANGQATSMVENLANGAVKTNTENIGKNTAAIAENAEAIEVLIGSVEGDDEKSVREIAAEETAKIVADADTKYDTLKEIADFILGDETGAAKMANDIEENAKAITALQNVVKDGGTLEVRVDTVESDVADNAAAIDVLQKLTSGYTGEKGIYNRIEAVSERAEKGITDAKAADDKAGAAATAAKNAQDDVDALEIVVSGTDGNGGVVKQAADSAALLAQITGTGGRITVAEGKITALEGIVSTGDDANSKLRSDIKTLQDLVIDDANKSNEKLYSEITRVAGIVDNTTSGVAATYAIADKNKTDIGTLNGQVAAIEAREAHYLVDTVGYVFNCGGATDNVGATTPQA